MYPGEYSSGRADSVRLPPSLGSRVASSSRRSPLASGKNVWELRKNLTLSVRTLDARVPQDDSDDEPAPKRSGRPAKGAQGDAPAKQAKRAKAGARAATAPAGSAARPRRRTAARRSDAPRRRARR